MTVSLSGIISNRSFTSLDVLQPYWPFKCFLSMASSFALIFALGSLCYLFLLSGLDFFLKLCIGSFLHQVSVQMWPPQRGFTDLLYQNAPLQMHTRLYSITWPSYVVSIEVFNTRNYLIYKIYSPSLSHHFQETIKLCEDWAVICLFAIAYSKPRFWGTLN